MSKVKAPVVVVPVMPKPACDPNCLSLFTAATKATETAAAAYLALGKALAADASRYVPAGSTHADTLHQVELCYATAFHALYTANANAKQSVVAVLAAQLAPTIMVVIKKAGKDRKGNPTAEVKAPAGILTATQAKNAKTAIVEYQKETDAAEAHAAALAAMSPAERVKAGNIETENRRAKEEQARQDTARALTVKALTHAAAMVENLPGVLADAEAYAFLQAGLLKQGLTLTKAKDAPVRGTMADQLKAA